ncbi:MAG: hypothetical protein KC535_05840, partial [Nanoarchaeota archaeon]|nr:hypothetical protein [Nanoarchaeota archaeon]
VLLIFHYLSDLATFFIPYFIPSITIDPFYMNFLGDPTGSSHLAISTLLSQEAVSSGASAFLGTVAYWFSGFGILVLLLFPVIFLYFILNDKDISSFFEKRRQSLLWYLLFLFAFIFEIAPWVRQQKIIANGIQGVDFLTQHISQVANIEIIGLLSLTLLLISLFLLNKKKLAKYAFTAVFLMSFSYLGQYIWNFYSSSVHYHVLVISSQNMFIGVLFSLSLLLETLFYLGGFFLLTYHASRIVIKEVVKELLTDTSAFVWTIIFILLPLSLLFAGTAKAFTLATIVIVTILIFSYAMHQLLIGNELRDDYLLGIIATIASYQFILIFEFILEETTRLTIATITFLEPFILLLIGYSLLKYFKLSFTLKKIPLLQIIKIAMIAFVFSLFFWLIAEPRPAIGNSLLVNGIYLFLVSAGEELLFRRLLFGLATKNFSRQKSNHLQALMFSLIHFVGIASIITYYQGGASHLFSSVTLNIGAWAVGLYLFGLIAARLVDASEKPSMSRTILFHFLVNFFVLIIF